MDAVENKINHQKNIAIIFCLFLAVLYVETVWKPFFEQGARNASIEHQSAATAPSAEQAPRAPSNAEQFDTPATVEKRMAQSSQSPTTAVSDLPVAAPVERSGYPSDGEITKAGLLSISTQTVRADISLLGGRITKLLLLNFPDSIENPDVPLDLVKHVEYAPYPLGVYNAAKNDAWVKYQLVESSKNISSGGDLSFSVDAGERAFFRLQGTFPDGRIIEKTLVFFGEDYIVETQVKFSGAAADSSRLEIEWTQLVDEESTSFLDPYRVAGYTWFDGKQAERETFSALEGDSKELGSVQWVSMADKYFMAALLAEGTNSSARALKTGELFRARLSGGDVSGRTRFFLGPKNYRHLQSLGGELHRNIDFGVTGIFSAPLLSLLHLFFDIFGNYGLAIVALTVLVKLILYPLNSASFRQMKAMQDIAPEIKRLRENVQDKHQQQMEMMALYKKKGVNPLGGCLPMLAQMPVFFGLYWALLLAIELRHAPFGFWIQDLSAPEKFMIGDFGIPVLVILFVISMLVQQWTTPSAMDPTQKKVMLIMPVVFGFMFANFPTGLTVYWLTNNLISIGQQRGLQGSHSKGTNAFKLTLVVSGGVFVIAALFAVLGA